jgi:Glycosyltransferase like family
MLCHDDITFISNQLRLILRAFKSAGIIAMSQECYTIVVAVNDMGVLQRNLYLSPGIRSENIELIIKRDYRSAALAYNEGLDEAKHDIVIFVHSDMYLPETWFVSLKQSLLCLEAEKVNWGVVGCYGVRKEGKEVRGLGRVYSNGMGNVGLEISRPEPVQTLDEIVLIMRKSSGLRFDPTLPHFHMYGTDICMSAKERGMSAYVIPAYCIHNTNQIVRLPEEFYKCCRHIKNRWRKFLPIFTPCISISRFDGNIRMRRMYELYSRLWNRDMIPASRVQDPRSLLQRK